MKLIQLKKILLLIICSSSFFITIYWSATNGIKNSGSTRSSPDRIIPVADVKKGNKWIVVTSVNYPTEDVKRLSSFEEWNLVVVADTKTPVDWKLETVHFLSVDYQKHLRLGLNQFDYEDTVSGVRYQVKNSSEIMPWIFWPDCV
ncbi:hypothetical protein CRE_12970 [Caenorhabditis remanei]|uniref:Uncharacterized protein n=1 Tax=Caenorhabditis remanei TaxID=31234 RepID=E3N120_CAERE|nr:hypothetical protein CRE_12970 [Caenorhabditis remanei]